MAELKEKNLCNREHIQKTGLYNQWAPKPLNAFSAFAKATFVDGELSKKEKELTAVGCAHILKCPYCIDYHVSLAKKASASDEEIAEASWIGVLMASNSVHDFFLANLQFLSPEGKENKVCENINKKFKQFNEDCLQNEALTRPFKILIAIACAYTIQSVDSAKHFVDSAVETGLSQAMIVEAIWVAVEMAGGASFGYSGLTAELLEEGC